MIANTDQEKARLLGLVTNVLELVRDGHRKTEDVSGVLQVVNDHSDFAARLLGKGPLPDGASVVADQPAATTNPESQPPVLPVYPANGEIFELTLNVDDPSVDPIEMVCRDGYENTENWRHTGTKLTGVITRRFKLVAIGYCQSFKEVEKRLKKQGCIPEGQWREALKDKYRQDGKGPVGVADASWTDPDGSARFPGVGGGGASSFRWSGNDFSDVWRWLVGVSE